MVRVEDLVPGFVATRIPDRPEWVGANQRDPRTAATVYGGFALAFSTVFFLVLATGNPLALAYVPLVGLNAYAWTWLLWSVRIPESGAVSRRRTLRTGLAIGTLSWLTVGFLLSAATVAGKLLVGTTFETMNAYGAMFAWGGLFTIAGFVLTLGIPTIASVAMAFWLLDYEERSGREKRESNYQFE